MFCIYKNNKISPTYDAMLVHSDEYFNECKIEKERICLNCIH